MVARRFAMSTHREFAAVILAAGKGTRLNSGVHKVLHNIAENTKDKSMMVATHSTATLNIVDRIIVLDRGKIIIDGPKQTVLAQLLGKQPTVVKRGKP